MPAPNRKNTKEYSVDQTCTVLSEKVMPTNTISQARRSGQMFFAGSKRRIPMAQSGCR